MLLAFGLKIKSIMTALSFFTMTHSLHTIKISRLESIEVIGRQRNTQPYSRLIDFRQLMKDLNLPNSSFL